MKAVLVLVLAALVCGVSARHHHRNSNSYLKEECAKEQTRLRCVGGTAAEEYDCMVKRAKLGEIKDDQCNAAMPCLADVAEFCEGVKAGRGRVHKCLAKNMDSLSEECANNLSHGHNKVMRACHPDVENFCKDVQPSKGKVIQCLAEHADELTEKCQTAHPCLSDIKKYCAGVSFRGGKMMHCLVKHTAQLTDACAKRVKTKSKMMKNKKKNKKIGWKHGENDNIAARYSGDDSNEDESDDDYEFGMDFGLSSSSFLGGLVVGLLLAGVVFAGFVIYRRQQSNRVAQEGHVVVSTDQLDHEGRLIVQQ